MLRRGVAFEVKWRSRAGYLRETVWVGHSLRLRSGQALSDAFDFDFDFVISSARGTIRATAGGLLCASGRYYLCVLLIVGIGGFTVFHVAGGLIHLLLVLAVISLIVHFVTGARTA